MTERVRIKLVNRLPDVRLGLGQPKTRATMTMATILKGDKGDKGDTITPADVVATLPVIDVFGVDGNRICTLYGDLA